MRPGGWVLRLRSRVEVLRFEIGATAWGERFPLPLFLVVVVVVARGADHGNG
jgi:hypothetical protein